MQTKKLGYWKNLCNKTRIFGNNSSEMAPNFARVDTAAARIGAFSRITLLKIYLMYLAGFVAFGPSTPVKYRIYEYNLFVF